MVEGKRDSVWPVVLGWPAHGVPRQLERKGSGGTTSRRGISESGNL